MDCGCKTIKNVGKGSQEEELPNRFARDDFTGASPAQRADNYYGKKKRPLDVAMDKMPKTIGITMTGYRV